MMNSNISGNPIYPNIVNSFKREVDNNVQLNELLRRENEQLKNTIKILEINQRNTDRLIEQNDTLIQKMAKEQEQLRIELNMARERERGARLFSEQLSTQNNQLLQQNSNLQNQHKDQLNAHQQELKQLIESFRDELRRKNEEIEEFRKQNEERNTVQLQNLKDSIEQKYYCIDRKVDSMQICMSRISGKFVLVSNWKYKNFLLSDNVERVNFENENLDSLVHSISSYRKELLLWAHGEYMNTTSECADLYANLLSLCQEWKRLRPDGEIHCLYCYIKEESLPKPSDELASLLTTCNKYLNNLTNASHIFAIRQFWPDFADLILSEKIKNKYPA